MLEAAQDRYQGATGEQNMWERLWRHTRVHTQAIAGIGVAVTADAEAWDWSCEPSAAVTQRLDSGYSVVPRVLLGCLCNVCMRCAAAVTEDFA